MIHNIKDAQLKSYMLHKLKNDYHVIKANRITLYNNNIFLFINRQCITILNIPDEIKAQDDVLISINKSLTRFLSICSFNDEFLIAISIARCVLLTISISSSYSNL